MNDELIERLRRTYRKEYSPTGSTVGSIAHGFCPFPLVATEVLFNPDGPAAAREIERLTAEVRRIDRDSIHTCWDECPRVVCMQRRKIEALTAQLAKAQQQASKLWALLDDIDTLDDARRGEDDLFRTLTRIAQQKRYAIMTAEEWYAAHVQLTRADPVRDTLADSDGDDGA